MPHPIIHPIVSTISFLTLVMLTLIANIIQIITMPITLVSPIMVYRINSCLANCVWLFCDFYFCKLSAATIKIVYANEIPMHQNAIVISNHLSFGDFFLIHHFAIRQRMLPFCRYFAKDSLKYIPVFGWGMYLMDCVLLKRDWSKDRERINKTFHNLLSHRFPVWIVSYVEGSRYSEAKARKSLEYTQKMNFAPLQHLLFPRTKGFVAALEAFRSGSQIRHVYDILLVYYHPKRGFGCAPTIADYFFGRLSEFTFHVYAKRHNIADIPLDPPGTANWLIDLFASNDRRLEEIKHQSTK